MKKAKKALQIEMFEDGICHMKTKGSLPLSKVLFLLEKAKQVALAEGELVAAKKKVDALCTL